MSHISKVVVSHTPHSSCTLVSCSGFISTHLSLFLAQSRCSPSWACCLEWSRRDKPGRIPQLLLLLPPPRPRLQGSIPWVKRRCIGCSVSFSHLFSFTFPENRSAELNAETLSAVCTNHSVSRFPHLASSSSAWHSLSRGLCSSQPYFHHCYFTSVNVFFYISLLFPARLLTSFLLLPL